MTTKTVTINDTLPDSTAQAIEELKDLFKEYLLENPDNDDVCLSNDIDYSGAFSEMIDSNMPIYTSDIDDAWYMHKQDLIEAYENAGIGSDPLENNGMTAIYCYIEQECWEWWHDNHEEIQDDVNELRDECEEGFDEALEELLDNHELLQ